MTELEKLSEELRHIKQANPGVDLSTLEDAFKAVADNYQKILPEPFQRIGTLRALATDPKTIIDVGVQSGTPPLYKAFNHLPFVLVDPQRGAETLLKHKPTNYQFVEKGLGAEPGVLTLREAASQSSFVERTERFGKEYPVEKEYQVPVTTFTELMRDLNAKPPYGVKIDTEGFELEVVKGMVGTMDQIDFLICETSIKRVYKDSYQFSELVAFLS